MSTAKMTAERRRHQLCAVARDLFLVSGYRGTTTLAVAERAGVSEALLMKHFGSKEALFREAIAEPVIEVLGVTVATNWERSTAARADTIADHVDRLVEFGLGWAELVRRHGSLLAAVLREANEFPDVVAQVKDMVAAIMKQVAESLGALTARQEYRPFDREVAAYAGLAAMGVAGLAFDDVEGYMAELVGILMVGLLSPAGREQLALGVREVGG